jgi:hypothetical protein
MSLSTHVKLVEKIREKIILNLRLINTQNQPKIFTKMSKMGSNGTFLKSRV